MRAWGGREGGEVQVSPQLSGVSKMAVRTGRTNGSFARVAQWEESRATVASWLVVRYCSTRSSSSDGSDSRFRSILTRFRVSTPALSDRARFIVVGGKVHFILDLGRRHARAVT